MQDTYSRLVLVACKNPRSIRAALRGNETGLQVSGLGSDEWLDVKLGVNGEVGARMQIRADGFSPILPGFAWCEVTKSGQGSPTTVKLVHNAN